MNNHEGQEMIYVVEFHSDNGSVVIGVCRSKRGANQIIKRFKEKKQMEGSIVFVVTTFYIVEEEHD